MKTIEQMSYRGTHSQRPQANIIYEESLKMWSAFFSWGEMDLAQKIFDNVRIFIEAYLNQSEVTNPFGFNPSLTGLENALHSGCALANDVIYRLINQVSLSSGAEGVIIIQKGQELALLSVGQPHIFIKRNQQLVPIVTAFDLTPRDFQNNLFLPNRLIGVHPTCPTQIQSFQVQEGDQLILLAHSLIPASFLNSYSNPQVNRLNLVFQNICKEFPQLPFWITELQL